MMEYETDAALAGLRLDSALRQLSGLSGLRGARRMIRGGRVRVNGRAVPASWRLRVGDKLEIAAKPGSGTSAKPSFIACQGDYCFFFKPAGMHTVSLAGADNASLEAFLPELGRQNGLPEDIILLQRLDWGTSGLVCAALDKKSALAYRQAEMDGKCRKYYLAVLEGRLETPVLVKNALAANGGRSVRVLAQSAPANGWTSFEPLRAYSETGATTVARCRLRCGKRHQIRAHAASIGHPLAGDILYGGRNDAGFQLVHYGLKFPGHKLFYLDSESPFANMRVLQCM